MKLIMLFVVVVAVIAYESSSIWARPSVKDAPRFGRWLVSQGSWGVLSVNTKGGVPFGNIASYSDATTGTPYFYLSSLDLTGQIAVKDSRACFTLSEISIDDCNSYDPQSPKCAKITLTGVLVRLPENSMEGAIAEAALFSAHPQFNGFPKMNGTFAVFKLDIQNIYLVNKAAPPRSLTVKEYLDVIM